MPNIYFTPAPELRADKHHIYRLVSDSKSREEAAAVFKEYDQLCQALRDLRLISGSVPAREKLHAAGIETMSDDTFRSVYLERIDTSPMEGIEMEIDNRIVARLQTRISPVIRRIQKAAIAELESHTQARPTELALAQRYGLPEDSVWSPMYVMLRDVAQSIRVDMAKEFSFGHLSDRRGAMNRYFSKPI